MVPKASNLHGIDRRRDGQARAERKLRVSPIHWKPAVPEVPDLSDYNLMNADEAPLQCWPDYVGDDQDQLDALYSAAGRGDARCGCLTSVPCARCEPLAAFISTAAARAMLTGVGLQITATEGYHEGFERVLRAATSSLVYRTDNLIFSNDFASIP